MLTFTKKNFHPLCDSLAEKDPMLQSILAAYGYPPYWTRPNTFETLVLTILEQQVSLASAYAAYKKLKEKVGEIIPQSVLQLSDEELRGCYFSRQKIVYVRGLADAILSGKINLEEFTKAEDEIVRKELTALKGIGNWTVDIYLLHALQRSDIFPIGDLALVNALHMLQEEKLSKESLLTLAENWRPYRSLATMLLWHFYISKKNIKLLH
ncbi:MAG: DNA-3-methyladenine glycosylase 2 family protein [Chitinophagaceae bacterium]|nr:MAG: DNA-3-methyladenine glycosylase 2 family protein [Chitinophagaceae bacterium]